MNDRLYGKYTISKANGEPTDTNAHYFVLRIDTDIHARIALRAYAKSIFSENPELARALRRWLLETHNTKAGGKEIEILANKAARGAPKGSFFNP